ncbi:hypothetical protein ACVS9P_06870 [Caproicibacterium sp. NSD3]
MAISERIRCIRNLHGMTQKALGMKVSFDKRNADVRIAQYGLKPERPQKNLSMLWSRHWTYRREL